MNYPQLNVIKKNTEVINELMGHDHRNVINDGFFFDTLNMCNDSYPTLRTRDKLKKAEMNQPESEYYMVKLVVADALYSVRVIENETDFTVKIYNENTGMFMNETTYIAEKNHSPQAVGMSNSIVLFPAKIVYECEENEFYDIDATYRPDFNAQQMERTGLRQTWTSTTAITYPKGDKSLLASILIDQEFANFIVSNNAQVDLTCTSFSLYSETLKRNVSCKLKGIEYASTEAGYFSNISYFLNIDLYEDLIASSKSEHVLRPTVTIDARAAAINSESVYVQATMADSNGHEITNYVKQNTAPEAPAGGDYWVDTSVSPHVVKIYSSGSSQWTQVLSAQYIIKVVNGVVAKDFKEKNSIYIHTEYYDEIGEHITCEDLQGVWTIQKISEDRTSFTINASLSDISIRLFNNCYFDRVSPDIDYACVSENRVFGCSNSANELYACALGDPYDWNKADDIAEDAYALKVGTDGEFTGCFNYAGSVMFFKQDTIHRLYGTKPQNYSLKTYENVEGVAKGASESAAVLGGVLYYKGVHGIYAFDGSYPQKVSDPFGDILYTGGIAGIYKTKYIIHMNEGTYAYDIQRGTWQKMSMENMISNICTHNTDAFFFTHEEEKYYLNAFENIPYDDAVDEDDLEWLIETGDLGLAYINHKWISRFIVRAEIDEAATFNIAVSYDDSDFETVYSTAGQKKLDLINIPIVARRCDHMRIKLYGIGNVRIYAISKDVEIGSEI